MAPEAAPQSVDERDGAVDDGFEALAIGRPSAKTMGLEEPMMTSTGGYSHRIIRVGGMALLTVLFASCKKEQAQAPAQQGQQAQGQAKEQAQGQDASTSAAAAPGAAAAQQKAPAVQNAAEAKQYSGAKITFYGDAVASELDKVLSQQFTQDTGIEVRVIPRPKDATESYAAYQRMFQSQSSDVDVLMLDVIWPGAFAQHLEDLGPKLGAVAKEHVESIVQNNTVNGKLIAIPWYTDFPMLYYRKDLLEKYGFNKPPETWDELEQMSKKIMDGEKGQSPNFTGFVWQGKAYEGLTCNALEWVASSGGGHIIDDGKPSVNNPKAIKALNRAKGWVGNISPAGVTGYEEEDARNAFQGGNAAFMRNWPYAYAAGNDDKSPIKGKFDVAPLPHDPGQKSAGTVGGWQLGVSKYSKNKDAAIEFVRYLASPEAQKYRAVTASLAPTIPSIQQDPEVVKAMPFLAKAKDLSLVTRPSNTTGARYNEASLAFFQGVSQVLQGQDAAKVAPQIDERLKRVMR
jgi:trehalose/maltose transport system substrate-binding protein